MRRGQTAQKLFGYDARPSSPRLGLRAFAQTAFRKEALTNTIRGTPLRIVACLPGFASAPTLLHFRSAGPKTLPPRAWTTAPLRFVPLRQPGKTGDFLCGHKRDGRTGDLQDEIRNGSLLTAAFGFWPLLI